MTKDRIANVILGLIVVFLLLLIGIGIVKVSSDMIDNENIKNSIQDGDEIKFVELYDKGITLYSNTNSEVTTIKNTSTQKVFDYVVHFATELDVTYDVNLYDSIEELPSNSKNYWTLSNGKVIQVVRKLKESNFQPFSMASIYTREVTTHQYRTNKDEILIKTTMKQTTEIIYKTESGLLDKDLSSFTKTGNIKEINYIYNYNGTTEVIDENHYSALPTEVTSFIENDLANLRTNYIETRVSSEHYKQPVTKITSLVFKGYYELI